ARAEADLLMSAAPKLRLILADDHPVVRDGLAAIINQQQDMEVVAEAEDGVAVVEELLAKHANARILIMTTHDGDEDIFRCLSQGAMGYLLKDAGRQEILSAIR